MNFIIFIKNFEQIFIILEILTKFLYLFLQKISMLYIFINIFDEIFYYQRKFVQNVYFKEISNKFPIYFYRYFRCFLYQQTFEKYSFNRNYDEMSVFRKFRCYLCMQKISMIFLFQYKILYFYRNFGKIYIFSSIEKFENKILLQQFRRNFCVYFDIIYFNRKFVFLRIF